ncbi:E3 ubiquitin protein ligase DRIP2-like isoform X5 [Cucumis melo]|uniref:E3 ubiquitin protein ligase DRIP2-like isoform X3 n=1 Tax=Cucumis melo TaxID=3656 RepID=A0A1S3C200_CUCME|nr:E3 ubiquitin protein ligase DRIP2-like isoform X5 [Cucumis melo]XP_008456094.1 E3 ubiquitin protein ligase DRIP2-like isoform X5 [Cucumis melo]
MAFKMPDHNLQDIRAKIFPLKRRKICAPEISPLASLPVKRKERSLSSLVVNTPKVSMQSGGLTGRRSKNVGRTAAALRGCNFGTEEPLKKEEDSGKDHTTSSSSSEYLKSVRFRQRRQDSSMAEPSNSLRHEHLKNNVEAVEGKADLWTPLNCLVEAANRTKSTKLNFQGSSTAKLEPSNVADCDVDAQESKEKALSLGAPNYGLYMPKARNKEHGSNPKAKDNHNNGTTSLPETMKRKRLRATARNKAAASGELGSPAQLVLDASAAKCRRNSPIWFTLIASEDSFRKGGFPLPQISTPYLRIKDGKMPVSSIQKYLVKKLDLKSEAEVEILCRGQPVLPTQQLQNLVDLWFRTASTAKKVPASVGSSAKDFVMVLSYCRKVQTP